MVIAQRHCVEVVPSVSYRGRGKTIQVQCNHFLTSDSICTFEVNFSVKPEVFCHIKLGWETGSCSSTMQYDKMSKKVQYLSPDHWLYRRAGLNNSPCSKQELVPKTWNWEIIIYYSVNITVNVTILFLLLFLIIILFFFIIFFLYSKLFKV